MKSIAIIGSGAIGGFYGAMLARAGLDVRFLMRSDLAAVKANGLRVRPPSASSTSSIPPPRRRPRSSAPLTW
jgi:2-dehydropantoate 2-reductase